MIRWESNLKEHELAFNYENQKSLFKDRRNWIMLLYFAWLHQLLSQYCADFEVITTLYKTQSRLGALKYFSSPLVPSLLPSFTPSLPSIFKPPCQFPFPISIRVILQFYQKKFKITPCYKIQAVVFLAFFPQIIFDLCYFILLSKIVFYSLYLWKIYWHAYNKSYNKIIC